jgi:hypothetical protein
MFEAIKHDLPNFPDEVIHDWLEYYANTLGWPTSHPRWLGILYGKDLAFWQNVHWEKQTLNPITIPMSRETNSVISDMYQAFVKNRDNIFSSHTDGKQRFRDAFVFFVTNGVFPRPICLLNQNNIYSVVDGNHRLLAYLTYSRMLEAYQLDRSQTTQPLNETLREQWGIEESTDFLPEHEMWVATT